MLPTTITPPPPPPTHSISLPSWPPSLASAWASSPILSFLPPLGWGKQPYIESLPSVVLNNIRDGPGLRPPLLILPTPPPQEIKASCPRGSAPSSEQIQHTQMHKSWTDALLPALRPYCGPASSNSSYVTVGPSLKSKNGPEPRCERWAWAGPQPAQGGEGQENGHQQSQKV